MQTGEEALKKAAEITRERVYDLLNMLRCNINKTADWIREAV